MNKQKVNCQFCIFCEKEFFEYYNNGHDEKKFIRGRCVKHPPVLVYKHEVFEQWLHPLVTDIDGCFEGENENDELG